MKKLIVNNLRNLKNITMGNEGLLTMILGLIGVIILSLATVSVIAFQKIMRSISLSGKHRILEEKTLNKKFSQVRINHK